MKSELVSNSSCYKEHSTVRRITSGNAKTFCHNARWR